MVYIFEACLTFTLAVTMQLLAGSLEMGLCGWVGAVNVSACGGGGGEAVNVSHPSM